jgi:hypothetical protein
MLAVVVVLSGVGAATIVWRNPFSWMMAIVGLAIFIDTLCLRLALPRR